jgi:hypothetical protein
MRESDAPRQAIRRSMPQITIEPDGAGFTVSVGGHAVRVCGDELNAHHWGKHAFEAVNCGVTRPREVDEAMQRLCLYATRYNLHN